MNEAELKRNSVLVRAMCGPSAAQQTLRCRTPAQAVCMRVVAVAAILGCGRGPEAAASGSVHTWFFHCCLNSCAD